MAAQPHQYVTSQCDLHCTCQEDLLKRHLARQVPFIGIFGQTLAIDPLDTDLDTINKNVTSISKHIHSS